jgi:DNA-directed RNA polymerase alpha subunit
MSISKNDRDVEIADLKAKLGVTTDARYRLEKRLERVLRFLEDHAREVAELEGKIHDELISGGRW